MFNIKIASKKLFESVSFVALFLFGLIYLPLTYIFRIGIYLAGAFIVLYVVALIATPILDKQIEKDDLRRAEWYEEFRAKVDEPMFPEFE